MEASNASMGEAPALERDAVEGGHGAYGAQPRLGCIGKKRDNDSRELRKENAAALDAFPKVRNNREAVVAERGEMPDVEAVGRFGGALAKRQGGSAQLLKRDARQWLPFGNGA